MEFDCDILAVVQTSCEVLRDPHLPAEGFIQVAEACAQLLQRLANAQKFTLALNVMMTELLADL